MTPIRTLPIAAACLLAVISLPAQAQVASPGATAPAANLRSPDSPAPSIPAGADPQAYDLLKSAYDHRQQLPALFAGFSADIAVNDAGTEVAGKLVYTPGKPMDLTLDNPATQMKWLRDAIGSLIGHRITGAFAQGDGSNPITFGADDHSPVGRLVALNDGLQSSYRVRDNQIVQVNRSMGDTKFTILVLDSLKTNEGKFLPRNFVVTYFDAGTGALKRAECFSDTYTEIHGAWLPTSRTIVTSENGAVVARSFALRNLKLLPQASASR
jgi:hypothetical protein